MVAGGLALRLRSGARESVEDAWLIQRARCAVREPHGENMGAGWALSGVSERTADRRPPAGGGRISQVWTSDVRRRANGEPREFEVVVTCGCEHQHAMKPMSPLMSDVRCGRCGLVDEDQAVSVSSLHGAHSRLWCLDSDPEYSLWLIR